MTFLIYNMVISTIRCLTARSLWLESLILCDSFRRCLIARTCSKRHIDNHFGANLTSIAQFIEPTVVGFDRSGLGSLACSLSFVGAPVGHDVYYHDGLVSFTPVEVDDLVLSSALSGDCTLTNNWTSPLLKRVILLLNEWSLLINFPGKHLFPLKSFGQLLMHLVHLDLRVRFWIRDSLLQDFSLRL